MSNKPYVISQDFELTFTQEEDCCSSEEQFITIKTQNGGGGDYFVINSNNMVTIKKFNDSQGIELISGDNSYPDSVKKFFRYIFLLMKKFYDNGVTGLFRLGLKINQRNRSSGIIF